MPSESVPSIEVVPYDPAWPIVFERVRARINELLPEAEVHHVGSTSVPGLVSKPTIDVMICVPAATPSEHIIEALGSAGLEFRPASFADSRERHLFFREVVHGRRAQHVHVTDAGSKLAHDFLAFRDYLRARPAEAEKYAEAKLLLLQQSRGDRGWYVDHKASVVDEMTGAARRWYAGRSRRRGETEDGSTRGRDS